MKKNELLNLKRRLVALSLAGGCLVGLTGCGGSEDSESNTVNLEIVSEVSESNTVNLEIVSEVEEKEHRRQLLAIYQDKALIIEPYTSNFNSDGCYYEICLSKGNNVDFFLPMSQFILFTSKSVLTAEEYVSIACGPDFPIEYIRSENYNRAR